MDDDTTNGTPSASDPLQPPDDLFNPRVDEEKLEQDGDPPAAPASDVPDSSPPDYPTTDTDLDAHDVYDEGLTSATNVDAQEESTPNNARPLEPEDESNGGTEHRAG